MTPTPDDNYARWTNHDYIGSFGRIPNEPKRKEQQLIENKHPWDIAQEIITEQNQAALAIKWSAIPHETI